MGSFATDRAVLEVGAGGVVHTFATMRGMIMPLIAAAAREATAAETRPVA